jgi:hypothetical protein
MFEWAQLLGSSVVFAELPSTESLITKYIPLGLLTVLLAALLFKAVRVWAEIHDVEEPDSPSDLLASFEQAHANGELDAAEFARVRDQLRGASAEGVVKSGSPPGDDTASKRMVVLEGSHEEKPPASPLD